MYPPIELKVGDIVEFDIGNYTQIGLIIGFDADDVLLLQSSDTIRRRNLRFDTESNIIKFLCRYNATNYPVPAWDNWMKNNA